MKRKKTFNIILIALAVVVIGIAGYTFHYYSSDSYLVLKGNSSDTVGLNGVYSDPGATAVLHGRDVSDQVKVSGKIDTETPGKYKLSYKAGNFTMQRTVTVLDEMDPVIQLKGEDDVTIKLGDEYKDPGFSATDSQGNDLTAQVEVDEADLNKAGNQKIRYTVSDAEGKTTQVSRTVKVEPNTEYETSGLPICMYHYVYDENDIPSDVNANYISKEDLSEELDWLIQEGYYFPTWQEVRDYVDGKLLLPEKSIVITFDDGAYSFLDNGIPVLEKYKVPATSFVITSHDGKKKLATEKYQSEYVQYESHSHDMHRGGGNIGHGGIMTVISHDDGVADLKKSIEIVGSGEAFAYPFGDTNDNTRSIVEDAGFLCAMTTTQGRAKPGDDPLMLPRQRMSRNQSMDAFKAMVSPF
ncbi:MAG: DUF5011 domain-containing protein [Bacillota bacterium]|nr:DUF5011 domain-containing protein [Bacillota bacterium]